jgi:hypothetical protein
VFDSEEEAAEFVNQRRRLLDGEFARLNMISGSSDSGSSGGGSVSRGRWMRVEVMDGGLGGLRWREGGKERWKDERRAWQGMEWKDRRR